MFLRAGRLVTKEDFAAGWCRVETVGAFVKLLLRRALALYSQDCQRSHSALYSRLSSTTPRFGVNA